MVKTLAIVVIGELITATLFVFTVIFYLFHR